MFKNTKIKDASGVHREQVLLDIHTDKKFDKIAQARKQGGNSSALQAKARAALDEAKANTPWMAGKADEIFRSTFGGGGSGTFAKTAEEKAQEAYTQRVTEHALTLGVSNEEAAKRIAMAENAEQSAISFASRDGGRGSAYYASRKFRVFGSSSSLYDTSPLLSESQNKSETFS